MKTTQIKTLDDLILLLKSLTEDEKRQAYALLQGMVIGKELAAQQDKSA